VPTGLSEMTMNAYVTGLAGPDFIDSQSRLEQAIRATTFDRPTLVLDPSQAARNYAR
jgi:hypothetical protein